MYFMSNLNSEFKKIKVIGFDLDQTLYPKSSEIDEAIQGYIYIKIAEHKGCSESEARELFNNLYKNGSGLSGGQTIKELGISNGSEIVQEALERADIAKFLHPNNEIGLLLNKLKKQYHNVDLITGSGGGIARRKLESLKIPKELFSNIIDGDIANKSNGAAYRMWLALYPKIKPEEFLYVGDRPMSDYVVPTGLGIRSILVNREKKDNEIHCIQLKALVDIDSILLR